MVFILFKILASISFLVVLHMVMKVHFSRLGTDDCMESYANTEGDLRVLKNSSVCKWYDCMKEIKMLPDIMAHKYPVLCRIEVSW